MREIFGDTSGWANFVDPRQPFHALAVRVYYDLRRQQGLIVTTNYVLAELVSLLRIKMRLPHSIVVGSSTT
jgi:predicted nucleic acid-binding protein